MRRGSHHRRGSLPKRGFLHTRGSLHEHLGTRAPGTSGHIVFLKSGKLRGTCASGRFNVRSLFLSLRSIPYTLPHDEAGSPLQNLILLTLMKNSVLPIQGELPFFFVLQCSVSPWFCSNATVDNYELLSYNYAHIGSSDRYASFLLAPAEAKGPFGYAYFRHKSEDLRGAFWKFPRVYFTQAFTYVQLGTFSVQD